MAKKKKVNKKTTKAAPRKKRRSSSGGSYANTMDDAIKGTFGVIIVSKLIDKI